MTRVDARRSQGQEDAILDRIFSRIGPTNRVAVECGARDGERYSNTYRLRMQGWRCVLLDRTPQAPIVHQVHLTAENISGVFAAHGVPADLDLLSIDVDGNDFHLWRVLVDYRPRVVVIEYNSRFGPDASAVMPYNPAHCWDRTDYYGASAAALIKLGREKGYGVVDFTPRMNLIFVRDDAMVPPADPWGYPTTDRPWETY